MFKEKVINHGVVRKPRGKKDFVAGENSPLAYSVLLESANYTPYAPKGENQFGYYKGVYVDKMSCVTMSHHKAVAFRLNCLIKLGLMPARHLKFLQDNGYIDETGSVNFNERISSILNGTTKDGNWLTVVADVANTVGMFPYGIVPDDQNLSWEKYNDKSIITPAILAIGKKFLEYFFMPYEWIAITPESFVKHLKHATIQVVIPGHAICNISQVGNDTGLFDSYSPFFRSVQYKSISDAMKIVAQPIGVKENVKRFKVEQKGKLGIMILEGFTGAIVFEDSYAEYLTQLQIANIPTDAPTIQIPVGNMFKIEDHGKLGICIVEGFTGSVLFENKFSEYQTLLQITGVPANAPLIQVP